MNSQSDDRPRARQFITSGPTAICALGLLGGLILVSRVASASSNYVNIETADDYSFYSNEYHFCVGTDCHTHDILCNEEGNGFGSVVASHGSPFFNSSVIYQDSDTWDADFIDVDVYSPIGDDQDSWDEPGSAIGFTCLHGTCKDVTTIKCNSGSDCPSGDVCVNTPPSLYQSHCANVVTKYLVTSTPSNQNGNFVPYSDGPSKWGESATNTWAGAGAVGGINLAVMINSCGMRAPFWQEIWPVFAGVHALAGIMPVTINDDGFADTLAWTSRGTMLATFMYQNLNNTMVFAWSATMDSAPLESGSGCPNFDGNFTAGGGHGINGCGAYYVAAMDATEASARWHLDSETVNDLTNDNYDATGNWWHYITFHCNYDCNKYGFTK